MRKPIGVYAFELVVALLALAGVVLYLVVAAPEGSKITKIEGQIAPIPQIQQTVKTIKHEIVTLPCTHGDDRTCRRFLAILLSDATRTQLRRLLAAKHIRLTPATVRALRRLERPRRHRHRRRRKGVMLGHGQGLPGRSRQARGRP